MMTLPGVKTDKEQRARLQKLMDYATSPTPGHCNFGAMLLLSPQGDVSFLAPIAPELRGVEIVAASPDRADGRIYDIWKNHHLAKPDLSMAEVVTWLNQQCQHSESDYLANGKKWLEDVFRYYRIPERR
jgi:hypothetical protein